MSRVDILCIEQVGPNKQVGWVKKAEYLSKFTASGILENSA